MEHSDWPRAGSNLFQTSPRLQNAQRHTQFRIFCFPFVCRLSECAVGHYRRQHSSGTVRFSCRRCANLASLSTQCFLSWVFDGLRFSAVSDGLKVCPRMFTDSDDECKQRVNLDAVQRLSTREQLREQNERPAEAEEHLCRKLQLVSGRTAPKLF